jgi:hypothetical protein
MGFGARLTSTKLTFLSRFSATSGAAHRNSLFFRDLHGHIMHVSSAARMINFDQCLEQHPKVALKIKLFPIVRVIQVLSLCVGITQTRSAPRFETEMLSRASINETDRKLIR